MSMEGFKLRLAGAILGLAVIFSWNVPNLMNVENSWWPSKKKLNYGLDIQGGLHLVMGVDVEGVMRESSRRLMQSLQSDFAKENIPGAKLEVSKAELGELRLTFSANEKAGVQKILSGNPYSTMLQTMSETESQMVVRYLEAYAIDYRSRVIQQAIETIRNRIDEFGVAEPSIAAQGADRILVQLPGVADAEKAKSLINTTAKLDFMLVENRAVDELLGWIAEVERAGGYDFKALKYSDYVTRVNADLKAKLPPNTQILFEKASQVESLEVGRVPLLVRTDTGLGGDSLADARVSFGQFGEPIVALRFDANGSEKFRLLTKENKGRQMAIALDRVIKTAPVIKDEIGGGQATITLGSRNMEQALNEAKMIATTLRAGSLPASLEQLEERRVGPSLGSDSIAKAQMASWVGALAVILFMLLRYKAMGALAVVSLAVNIAGVFALLTSLGATLTLPGIAGIALTVGFAVDANVLINERMREELRKGASFIAAIREGYARAMSAILDSNITTAATAVVLLFFGTGPVKGFAVTLLVGIGTTLFANVFFSKVLVDLLVAKFRVQKISV
ncbi:MAG: protein translocase subunit SecD [Bdellovibrio sp.]